jgi:hypothetical protein
MSTTMFEENGIISFSSIANEKDLKRGDGLYINPPPQDGRYECCGRHISELKPFGTARHLYFGDLDGALLVKAWRPLLPDDPRPQSIYDEMIVTGEPGNLFENSTRYLMEKSCHGKTTELRVYHFSGNSKVGAIWECRDCFFLDEAEYLELMRQRRAA